MANDSGNESPGGKEPLGAITPAAMRELMRVALGEAKADLVIRDGTVVNVYSGELQERCTVVVKGKRIAYLSRDFQAAVGPETEVVDAAGKLVIPGFLDGHTHVVNRYAVEELVRYTVPTGTTTVIAETLELTFPCGIEAIGAMLAAFADQPIRILATLPALTTNDPPWPGIAPAVADYAAYLADDAIVGLGESYWATVLRGDDRLLEHFCAVQAARKTLEGHTAGARGNRMQAYLATGQTSCHEPIVVDHAIELLRLGVHVLLRRGAIRSDLAATAAIKDAGVDLRRLAVASDSIEPADLLAGRYMNAIVQEAIELGFDPITAIRMGSLNVAEHFHLDNWLGGMAPGKMADMSIVPDLRRIVPEQVICRGRVIASEGQVLVAPRPVRYPAEFYQSMRLRPDYRAADFRIAAPGGGGTTVNIIDQITELVTQQALRLLPATDGELRAQPEQDVIKVAAIERRKGQGEQFVGFIAGHGLRRGAFATTMAWDSTNMVIVGADDADMALAVNHLVERQGGAVVCADGKVVAEFAAPVCGVCSERPLPEIVAALAALQEAVTALGSTQPRHLLTLDTLTTAAIPHFRINHAGYYNLREGQGHGLFA